jgi:hypothetical protein
MSQSHLLSQPLFNQQQQNNFRESINIIIDSLEELKEYDFGLLRQLNKAAYEALNSSIYTTTRLVDSMNVICSTLEDDMIEEIESQPPNYHSIQVKKEV